MHMMQQLMLLLPRVQQKQEPTQNPHSRHPEEGGSDAIGILTGSRQWSVSVRLSGCAQ